MDDTRMGLKGKTRRELVEILLTEVSQWSGAVLMAEEQRVQVKVVLALLTERRLSPAESHWYALCEIWFHRSSRPDVWLRDFWVETLFQWVRFMYEDEFAADELPELQTTFMDLPQ